MASETEVPDQTANQHPEVKKVNGSIQNVEQEQSKEQAGDNKEKVDAGPVSGELAALESEKGTDDEKIDDSRNKVDDEKTEVPASVEGMKAEESVMAPGSNVTVDDGIKEVNDSSDQTPITTSAFETAVEVAKKEPEEPQKMTNVPEPKTEGVVEKPEKHSEESMTPESQIEVPKAPEVSESVTEAVDKPKEQLETAAVLGSAPEKSKDEANILDIPKSVPDVEEKQEEKSAVSVTKELVIDDGEEFENKIEKLAVEVNTESEVQKEVFPTDKINVETESKDELSAEDKVSDVNKIGNGDAGAEDANKQESKVDSIDVALKDKAIEHNPSRATGLTEDIDTPSVTQITEELKEVEEKIKEEKKDDVKTDKVVLTEATKTVNVSEPDPDSEVTEDAFEGNKTSRDAEAVSEEKEKEVVKDDVPTSIEISKDIDAGGADVNKPIDKPKEPELEAKGMEPIETNIDKKEKAEEKNGEPLETKALNSVDSKDSGDKNTVGEVTKREVPAKPAKSQSNNIMSKVKQSIVKVKKAIIGKSPSSKTLSSEPKGEIKVK